jgi:hypothetical protein
MLPSGNVAQKRHMTCLCLLDFDPKIFHILGFCRGRSTPFYAVLRRSTPFYAALRRSTPFYAVLRRSTSDSQPPPQTVGHSPPPVLPNSRKYFSKIQFFQKNKNDPTQICPLGTHEQQICDFLFEAFRRGKMGGVVF